VLSLNTYAYMSPYTIYVAEVPRTNVLYTYIGTLIYYYKIWYSTRVYFAGESATPNDKNLIKNRDKLCILHILYASCLY